MHSIIVKCISQLNFCNCIRFIKSIFIIISIIGIIVIINELKDTCLINNSFSKPIEKSIKDYLENIYNQDVIINRIDGCVEDNTRIVYFELENINKEKIVLYVNSFLPKRLKYIDEIQSIEKYKEYF
ncbi:hypothetical protein KQI36_07725 [Clostridium senegalense]|uniref:hypothetical protein n=1 Tax=Clostridium senegalense TaxID=1465809 RepID=UPI001C123C59|nr:hypothetical protein [Clostridium senegalense]MBU5226532.1 hypothetical protein [Clostridium senegalense]